MLVLRLARTGRRNQPKYRLVVAEHSKPIDGKVVEVVGHYNPIDANKPLEINREAVSAWLAKGIQPSNTVAKLLNKEGFDLPVHLHPVRPAKKAPKEEPKVASEPTDETPSQPEPTEASEEVVAESMEPTTEAVVEEVPAEVASVEEPVASEQPEVVAMEVPVDEEPTGEEPTAS